MSNVIKGNVGSLYYLANGLVKDPVNLSSFHPLSNVNMLIIHIEDGGGENTVTMINYKSEDVRIPSSHNFPLFYRGPIEHTVSGESNPRTFAQYVTYIPTPVSRYNVNRKTPMNVSLTVTQESGMNFVGIFATTTLLNAHQGSEELDLAYVTDDLDYGYYQYVGGLWEKVDDEDINGIVSAKQYNLGNIVIQGGFAPTLPITTLTDEQYKLIWQELETQSGLIFSLQEQVNSIFLDVDMLKEDSIRAVEDTFSIDMTIEDVNALDPNEGKKVKSDLRIDPASSNMIEVGIDGVKVDDNRVVELEQDVVEINQEIDGLKDGTVPFEKVTLKDPSNNLTEITYTSKVAQDNEVARLEQDKADITYVNAQDNILDEKIDSVELGLQNQITGNDDDIQEIRDTNFVVDWTINETNYIVTVSKYDGTQVQYDLPLETMVVDAYYDAVNKDLVIVLQNGHEVSVPVDDIFLGLATQAWVTQQLTNYYTQTQLNNGALDSRYYTEDESNALLNERVNRDLSVYTEKLTLDDNDQIFLNDSTNSYNPRRSTFKHLKDQIVIDGEVFDASVDYAQEGLGSFKSATTRVYALTLQSSGDYRTNVRIPETNTVVLVRFPNTSANQNLLRVSLNNGTTYYNVVKNGGRFRASVVSNQLVRLEFDGTQFIADIQGDVEVLETYSNRISSTFGKFNPINDGMPIVKEIQGRTIPALENLVTNGDFSNGTTGFSISNATGSVTGGIYSFTPTSQFGSIVSTINISANNVYYYIARVKSSSLNTVLLISDNVNYATTIGTHTGNGSYQIIKGSSIQSTVATPNTIRVRSNLTSAWTQIDVDYMMTFNLTASHGVTATSGTAYDNAVADIEAMLALNGGYVSTTSTTHLEDSEFKSRGVNLFNVLEWATAYAYKIPVKASTVYTWSESIAYKLYDAQNNELASGTASTVTTTSQTRYIAYNTITATSTFMLVEGATLPSVYAPYNSETQKFNHSRLSKLPNGVADKIRLLNGAYVLDRYVQEYTLQADDIDFFNNTTFTNYDFLTISQNGYVDWLRSGTSHIFPNFPNSTLTTDTTTVHNTSYVGAYYGTTKIGLRVPKGTYANLAAAQSALAGTKIWYQLATPLLATEVIDVDGTLIQESTTTVEQLQNIPTNVSIEYAMNIEQTTKTLVERDKLQQLEIDNLEVDVATRQLRLGGITASRPTTPSLYQMYFDTTLNVPIWWNGTNWVNHEGTTV